LVDLLLSKGALINDKDFNKETLLSLVLEKKYYKFVDILHSKYLNYESKTKYNDTPLRIAVKYINLEVIETVLKYNANVNTTNEKNNKQCYIWLTI
jgi:ankyrin repeat protein